MTLTDGQKNAVRQALLWYYSEDRKPVFVCAGVAGSGKSTTVNTLVNTLGLEPYQVLYVTPTGKAAGVLRMKGCTANTIHKTFYLVHKLNGRVVFSKKKTLPSTIKLIVIDELSMVNQKIMDDILSYNCPTICLGDPCQIPAMYGENEFIKHPDVFLNQVMRQEGTSGILDLATKARNHEHIENGIYKESRVINLNEVTDIEKYDVVICWKNSTRRELNSLIRKKLGYTSKYPSKGEKLLCLKNNYVHLLEYKEDIPIILVNGLSLINLENSKEEGDYLQCKFTPEFILNDESKFFESRVDKRVFDSYITGEEIPDTASFNDIPEDVTVLDFGYAMTTHKMQGSSAANVLYIDEFKGSEDMYWKMLYTGITRAEKSITIARTLL